MRFERSRTGTVLRIWQDSQLETQMGFVIHIECGDPVSKSSNSSQCFWYIMKIRDQTKIEGNIKSGSRCPVPNPECPKKTAGRNASHYTRWSPTSNFDMNCNSRLEYRIYIGESPLQIVKFTSCHLVRLFSSMPAFLEVSKKITVASQYPKKHFWK